MKQLSVDFIELCSKTLPIKGTIIEFGSRRAEGQERYRDIREFFPDCTYVGADMQEGNKVDYVDDMLHSSFPDNYADVVICLDTLEHVIDPFEAVDEVQRILKPDGIFILTVPFDCPIHNHPFDYWRFTPDGIWILLNDFNNVKIHSFGEEKNPHSVAAIATNRKDFNWYNYMYGMLKLQRGHYKERPYSFELFVKSFVPPVVRNLIKWPKEKL